MKISEKSIEGVRDSHLGVCDRGDRRAVIVSTDLQSGRFLLGVQFWTKEMVEKGQSQNCDPGKSTSTMVCYLNQPYDKFDGTTQASREDALSEA
jgi:hypothetical protein